MATNKNQHFVPRCYLRSFTKDEQGTAINLYNIDRLRFVPNAPVKNQCSGDYFYGTNQRLEDAMQSLEGGYAFALREIRSANFELSAEISRTIRWFWLLQHMRTEAAAQRSALFFAAMADLVGRAGSELRVQIKEAVQLAMHAFASKMDSIDDLKLCLVRNCTRVPFMTSDDPAVLTNRFYLIDGRRRSWSFGIEDAGAIFLLPMTPDILCLGYDSDVYSVKNKGGWVRIRRESDVDAFNEHQILNCRANIFVKEGEHQPYVERLVEKFGKNRLTHRHAASYAVVDKVAGHYKHYKVVESSDKESDLDTLLHVQAKFPLPSSWPSQISWRILRYAYENKIGTGYLRARHVPTEGRSAYRKVRIIS